MNKPVRIRHPKHIQNNETQLNTKLGRGHLFFSLVSWGAEGLVVPHVTSETANEKLERKKEI